jgi:hypothetical protein
VTYVNYFRLAFIQILLSVFLWWVWVKWDLDFPQLPFLWWVWVKWDLDFPQLPYVTDVDRSISDQQLKLFYIIILSSSPLFSTSIKNILYYNLKLMFNGVWIFLWVGVWISRFASPSYELVELWYIFFETIKLWNFFYLKGVKVENYFVSIIWFF